ncbi:MAG: indolepyruvate ferredoxin oxidoreductase subunit alpha [Bacillota bacterium]|nr:indolepyruvate ferredoxin oxidoreductase subunit alpha [Bacillota bacterium]
MKKKLLTGNEAIAQGAWEAGVRVAAAYPGTPSTEILQNLCKYNGIYSEWSPNEKVALEVGIGASIAGARALVTMKHVGVNVAADPLFTFSYTGVNGGLVLVSADEPGMHSSQNEQDNRHLARAAKIPVIEPSDSQEAKDFIKLAYQISEEYDTPVMYRTTTRINHSQSLVELEERADVPLKEYEKNQQKYIMMPAYARLRHPIVEARKAELVQFGNSSSLNRVEWGNQRKVGIITHGISYQYVKEAFGQEVSILKLGMTYPLPHTLIADFVNSCEKVLVVEELEPFIENEIRALGLEVIGKELLTPIGEYSVQLLTEKLSPIVFGEAARETAASKALYAIEEPAPPRPPVLCAGCPHRGAFYVFNKLKLTVAGDIGCYTLGALPPFGAMDTCICMGSSISSAMGMEKARGKEFARKLISVIGDSTFLHTGINSLLDLVYNKGTSTVVILDNSITAMTGHQDHPGTGRTITQEPAPQVDLIKLVEAIGIKSIRVVDPYELMELENILKEELAKEEPSVIICKRPCALIDKGSWTNPVNVDQEICTGCKRCMKLGCPGLALHGEKVSCNETQCTGCGLCIKVCKFDAIKAGEQ